MSHLGSSQIGNYQPPTNLPPVPTTPPPPLPSDVGQTGSTTPKPFVAKSDVQSRVAQQELLQNIKERPLGARKITVDNLISKDGMKFALGKVSGYAKFKDGFIRTAYKALNGTTKVGEGTGSLHRSAIRQADKYQKLVDQGAPESERLGALRELRTTLDQMHTKLHGFNTDFAAIEDHPVTDMLKFVDQTISSHPTEHLAKGKQMMDSGYSALKEKGASIQDKLEFLSQAEDHLLAAKEGGVIDPSGTKALEDCQQEMAQLTSHAPLKSELADFVKNKATKLNHVVTRETSAIEGYRKNEAFMRQEDRSTVQDLRQWRVGLGIREFDKSTLNHVKTEERTGLESAKQQFHSSSFDDGMVHIQPGPKPTGKTAIVQEPSLGTFGGALTNNPTLKKLTKDIDVALSKGKKEEAAKLSQQLGTFLSTEMSKLTADQRLGFVTSHGETFKSELQAQMLADNPTATQFALKDGKASPELQKVLDSAYSVAVSNLPDRAVGDNQIVLDNVTYTKVKNLGGGGFGSVDLYEGLRNGKTEQIAVKSSLNKDIEAGFKEHATEVRIHRDATEGNPAQIIGFKGAVQTPDGRILIAMESAPHGTLLDMSNNLKKAVAQGLISPQSANVVRITLFKDLLKGVQHFQEQRGLTHFDIKGPNFLIGKDGITKLADFGTGATSLDRSLPKKLVDNPIYTAPEILIQDRDRNANIPEDIARNLKKSLALAKEQLSPEDYQELRNQAKDYLDEHDQAIAKATSEKPDIILNEKADTWSAGVTAYELFFGEPPFNADFMSVIEDQLVKFAEDPTSKISLLGKDSDQESVGTGATQLDRLLNQMLHPIPDERPTISDLLDHSLFTEPGVGEPDVRDLILLLSDPKTDPSKLKEASDKLGI